MINPMMMNMFMKGGEAFTSGLQGFLGGLTGNSEGPYEDAMKQYEKYGNKAAAGQQPYMEAGQRGMGNFEDWLKGQKDPSGFINHLMSQYQTSPYAKFQMQQGQNAANNAASASGLMGSTPFMQASQDYAHNISQQDMNQWLQNVLGVNTQYGAGQNALMQGGQNAANALTNLYSHMGDQMGAAAYGREAGKNQDRSNMWGGLIKMFTGFGGNNLSGQGGQSGGGGGFGF